MSPARVFFDRRHRAGTPPKKPDSNSFAAIHGCFGATPSDRSRHRARSVSSPSPFRRSSRPSTVITSHFFPVRWSRPTTLSKNQSKAQAAWGRRFTEAGSVRLYSAQPYERYPMPPPRNGGSPAGTEFRAPFTAPSSGLERVIFLLRHASLHEANALTGTRVRRDRIKSR